MDSATIEELEWKHPAELTEEETLSLGRLPRLGRIQQTLVGLIATTIDMMAFALAALPDKCGLMLLESTADIFTCLLDLSIFE